MRLILTIFIVLALSSCKPKVINDQETLNIILADNKYQIKVESCGCFGCGTYTYKVNINNGKATITNSSGKEKIEVSNDSLDSFKNFISERIGQIINSDLVLCTSRYEYQVDNGNLAVTFSDETCSAWDKLNSIIPLRSIPESFK